MRQLIGFICFTFLFCSCWGGKDPRFEFPDDFEPKKYLVKLKTDFKNAKRFWGVVTIKVTCAKVTKQVVLNAKDLEIDDNSVKVLLEESKEPIDLSDPDTNPEAEQYIIQAKTEFVPGKEYEIHISYSREFSHNFNVYQFYSITDEKSHSKEYYGFTRIGPGQARTLFPSMDQMKFKAEFEIIHDHPGGVTGFSNMPLLGTENSLQGEDWKSDVFRTSTIPLSTHTIGFALAKLEEKQEKDPYSGAPISIWSSSRTYHLTDFFLQMIIRILNFYSEYLKVNYPLPKLDILILPDYKGGYDKDTAGLIIFGNSKTLYDEVLNINEKTNMAKEMCEGICRQWFGVYTTMSQWNQHWLHRALVQLFSTLCIKKAFPQQEWKYADSYDLITFTEVLENDLDKSAEPVYNPDDNVDYSYMYFDSLVSGKAYLLVRMLRMTVGEVVFQSSLEEYLKTNGKENSSLEQFWKIVNNKAKEANNVLQDIDVQQLMDSWTTKSRYPIFKVNREYQTNMVTVTQEPFEVSEEERKVEKTDSSKDCWDSLLTYKTQGGSIDSEGRRWFLCSKRSEFKIYLQDLPINNWIIFNLRIQAPFRTLYDYHNWDLLSKTLLANKFEDIDDLTRADLLFDMFEFAGTRILENLNYPFVLNTLKYLVNEESYSVWLVVAHELQKLLSNLFRTKIFDSFQEYMRVILTKVFEKWEKEDFSEHMLLDADSKHKNLIFNVTCRFGVARCVTQCSELFDIWYSGINSAEDKPVLEDIRDTVLCYAVKQDSKKWHELYKKYDRADKYKINSNVLMAMGCSTDSETLEEYLDNILSPSIDIADSDREHIFNGLAWNKDGYPLVKNFLITNYKSIETRFPGKTDFVDTYLEKLLNATKTREDLNEITEFMQKIRPKENDEYKTLWEENVAKVDRNVRWYEKNENSLSDFLEDQDLTKLFE